jgi:Mg2+/Co2+ transporter CorB
MHGDAAGSISADLAIPLIIVLGCIVLSAFFAGSETALTAASRTQMHALERNGSRRAAAVNLLLRRRARLLGAILLGNTIVNIGASAFTTNIFVSLVGPAGVFYATILMTLLLLIFAEVLPKTVAIGYSEQVSLAVAPVVTFFVHLFGPILVGVDAIVRGILWLFGLSVGGHTSLLSGREELRSAVDLLHREGGVARSDREMFSGVLELNELTVWDVMIHRTRMRAIDADLPPEEVLREVIESPYTRMPLWRGEPENIIGVLHAKDLLRAIAAAGGETKDLKIDDIALDPWFVPDSTTLEEQLQAFRARKQHFALVVDEYGEVMGLVTLEDILEEIVGDIKDEHDVVVQGLRRQPDGSVQVDGAVPIRDLNRAMDWDLPDEEATTLAGLVIHEARAIPDVGQVFTFHGFRFEVLRKTRNRITGLKISPVPREADERVS